MKKLFEKYRAKLVRLADGIAGTVIGYSDSHLIMLLEEGVEASYSFTLDDIGDENPYIDFSLIGDCEVCFMSWLDEGQIKKNGNKKTDSGVI